MCMRMTGLAKRNKILRDIICIVTIFMVQVDGRSSTTVFTDSFKMLLIELVPPTTLVTAKIIVPCHDLVDTLLGYAEVLGGLGVGTADGIVFFNQFFVYIVLHG